MEDSLKFYRDRLGLQAAGESLNYGTEQEHLNNVFGAKLRITSLRASKGFKILSAPFTEQNAHGKSLICTFCFLCCQRNQSFSMRKVF